MTTTKHDASAPKLSSRGSFSPDNRLYGQPLASSGTPAASRASAVLWLLSLMTISKACTPALMGAVVAGIFFVLQLLSLTGSVYECFWGVPECYLALVPLFFIAFGEVCKFGFGPDFFVGINGTVPDRRGFAMLWSLQLAIVLAIDWPARVKYYRWRLSSGIERCRGRGLGLHNKPAFGFIKIPALSAESFDLLGASLAVGFAVASWPSMAHPAFFSALFLPFLVYCGQLGQETALGEHAGLLAPATLLFLSLSITSPWVFSLLKLYIVSLYVGAACGKLITSFYQRKAWWSAPTLQAYLFGALCSRPGDSFVDGLARFIIERPPLCMLLAVGGLGLELATPLALVAAPFSVLIGSSLIAFHFGVYLLQGINFISYWAPALFVFIANPAPLVDLGGATWLRRDVLMPADDADALEWARWAAALLVLTTQLVCCFSFREVTTGGPMPFTCMPVFAIVANVFDDSVPYCRTVHFSGLRSKMRCCGQISCLEWLGPLFGDDTDFSCPEADVVKLPFPVMWVSFKGAGAEWMGAVLKPKYQDNTLSVFSNRSLPDELLSAVRRCSQFILDGTPDDAYDRAKVRELLRLQAACKAEFEKVVVEGDDEMAAMPVFVSRGDSLLK